jgi:putative membrane protein
MTKLSIVSALASALALVGCSSSESEEPEGSTYTEGSEGTTTTSVEEWRAEEERPAEERVEDPGVVADTGMTAPEMQPEMQSAKGEVALSDGEIAKVTEVVNSGEIEQAQLAKTKAKNAKVKKFAQHMITEHTKAKQTGAKLVKQEQLITQDNAIATEVSNDGNAMLQSLRNAEPEGFDLVYINGQVDQHQKVLDMLDKQLIPAADDPELKAELEKARGMVERHLTEAREIQQTLTTAAATD